MNTRSLDGKSGHVYNLVTNPSSNGPQHAFFQVMVSEQGEGSKALNAGMFH